MEEITEGVNNMNIVVEGKAKNRIQVSNTKKPLFFYVNLAKVTKTLDPFCAICSFIRVVIGFLNPRWRTSVFFFVFLSSSVFMISNDWSVTFK